MKNVIIRSLLLPLGVAFAAAAPPAERPPLQHAMMGVSNGCFVETVAFLDQWRATMGGDAWARLLQWGAREEDEIVAGHAVGVCEARGTFWSWDINFGWTRLKVEAARRDDPAVVSDAVLKRYPRVTARYPTYRFDFPQVAAATRPSAQPGNENASLRDASVAGERLARHRPVNVVRFVRTEGAEKSEGGAAIFVFHGRYCVYVPEVGTIPFRVRGDVQNLRLIQQLLRRIYPGVGEVKRLQ